MTEVNYAPAGATHYDFFAGYLRWLKYEKVWMYFDDSECLIEVDNPVTSSVTNSQAKEMELDMLKGEKWMPEIGEICEATWGTKASWWLGVLNDNEGVWVKRNNDEPWSYLDIDDTFEFRPLKTPDKTQKQKMRDDMLKGENTEPEYTHEYSDYGVMKRCTIFCDEKDANGNIVVKNAFDEFVLTQADDVWPIKTPEQKAREEFATRLLEMSPDDFYNHLKNKGVDLMTIIKEQTK